MSDLSEKPPEHEEKAARPRAGGSAGFGLLVGFVLIVLLVALLT